MKLAAVLLGLVLAGCAGAPATVADGDRRVATKSGVLVGETVAGVSSFKGVPFAQPPVGALRWAAPRPVSWSGEREAKTFALPCPQPVNADGRPNGAGVVGGSKEDCLYLNVWAPANAR